MLVIKLSCKPKFLGNPFSDSEDSDTEMHVTMRYAYFKPVFRIRNIYPLDTDPPENELEFHLLTTLLRIRFRNYRDNYIKTGHQNKEINFHILTDPIACYNPFSFYNKYRISE